MELSSAKAGGNYTPAPSGMHRAICYRFIDLGTQESEYQGETKHLRKILLSFELVDEIMEYEIDGEKRSGPFSVHQRFTWSMHEKSKLRPFLESWRGKPFSETDLAAGGFDAKNLVGVGCYLNVIHNEANGRTYANISSANPLPKKAAEGMPGAANDLVYLALEKDRFDWDAFNALHENIRETIQRSPEYRDIAGTGHSDDGNNPPAPPPADADMDEEIPF